MRSDTVVAELKPEKSSWFDSSWLSWTKHSNTMLRTIEKKILQYCSTTYRGWFVDVGPVVGPADRIWTISMNVESPRTPLVMLHGLGAGVALWCMNLDALAANRPVYAFDLLGFGRSSRPCFSNDAMEAEVQLVRSIEEWRKEMKLEKFVLLGHSMGGFLAASYAISHPERVKHLVLADPWGFPERSPEPAKRDTPLWIKALVYTLQPLNPLWAVRAAGPLGQWLVSTARPDITKKFSVFVKEESLVTQYLYQCNSQQPSGESAFHSMMSGFGWAKHPMVNRIEQLDKTVPITLVYGSRSWVDNSAGEIIKEKRHDSEVNLQVIVGAGHHVYADKPEVFNEYVIEACDKADGVYSPNAIESSGQLAIADVPSSPSVLKDDKDK
ncbi:(Lyso)-N-acylphosphatidylethanolamine lipase isoform X3 [Atheta coriaria]|uniref:(Lyso)-N-acylphosphatidylethanolamine lipase isoform X3 n=1 Tax=Dalotia coriaria TaxID=877792 RepID=UPI0031F42C89